MSDEKRLTVKDQTTSFLMYSTPEEKVRIEVILHNETLWLSQKQISDLFDVGKSAISKHLKNIFESGELNEESVVSILETTAEDNKRYKVKYYNLDAIISIGYRVNSGKATKFRIWATKLLKEYLIKGFILDDERLKNGRYFGKDYFRELIERVRSIRASERRIYQKLTDIFAECSIDYDSNSPVTKEFFAHVQDKFHYAITGHTSAELIYNNVDAEKPLMGMFSYKKSPHGRVLKSDVVIGKNYLNETQIKTLERTVSSFFDYIESILEKRTEFTMKAFSESVNKFLEFHEYKILEGFGNISRKQAEKKAFNEYDKFNRIQNIESDFDRMIKKALKEDKDVE